MRRRGGYTMVTLLVFLSVLVIGLLVAVPVWTTQLQRENEEELIFRGNQYVEAVRRYQQKNPGQFPKDIEELVKKRFLRKAFRDPMTKDGRWYLVTQDQRLAARPRSSFSTPSQRGGGAGEQAGQIGGRSVQVLLIPEETAKGMSNLRILGVASTSPRDSIRVYNDATKYAEWLFYFGMDPNVKPEITIYGQEEKK
jgi:type II secretory pathway pseudopilin PulG